MFKVCRSAYAKVNFGLKVLPARGDGFHNLESIFQTVDLEDVLTVTDSGGDGCFVECDSMELPLENTLTKTYCAFETVTGLKLPGVKVKLEKGIPSGGGLGGGSSDAAAFLSALEEISGAKLTRDQIFEIAGLVGSDVFFFAAFEDGKGCAKVSGRGEVVEPIKGREDLFLLLVFPSVSSSTKKAYQLVDEYLSNHNDDVYPQFDELEKEYNCRVQNWTFINTFTPAVTGEYPEIAEALNAVIETGAFFSSMSGSGSTVFGLYESIEAAESAKAKLDHKWACKATRTIC